MGAITRVGRAVGGVVQTFNQAARNTLDIVIKNIIPFMMFDKCHRRYCKLYWNWNNSCEPGKTIGRKSSGTVMSVDFLWHSIFCHLYLDLVR